MGVLVTPFLVERQTRHVALRVDVESDARVPPIVQTRECRPARVLTAIGPFPVRKAFHCV